MTNIYKIRIEIEVGLLAEAQRDTLAQKVLTAKNTLIANLPSGSQVGVALVSKWDELEKSVLVIERVNKEVI